MRVLVRGMTYRPYSLITDWITATSWAKPSFASTLCLVLSHMTADPQSALMLSVPRGRLREGEAGVFLDVFTPTMWWWRSPFPAKAGAGPVGRIEALAAVSGPAKAAVRQGATEAERQEFTERENKVYLEKNRFYSDPLKSILGLLETILTPSGVSPRRIDPDNIQMAEVDAFLILPVVAGAAFGPDAVRTCSLSLPLCCVRQWKSPTWKKKKNNQSSKFIMRLQIDFVRTCVWLWSQVTHTEIHCAGKHTQWAQCENALIKLESNKTEYLLIGDKYLTPTQSLLLLLSNNYYV